MSAGAVEAGVQSLRTTARLADNAGATRHGHRDTRAWVEALRNLASRTGMKELTLRSLRHGAALGSEGDAAAAAMLAAEIDTA